MKVALVTSIPHGGPVEHAVLLARDLSRLGVDVRAVACTPQVAARFPRAAVLPLARPLDPVGAMRVHRYVRGVDVVHTHDRRSGLWVRLLPPRGSLRVHTLHGLPDPYLGTPGWRARLAYGGLERHLPTDVLIAPSHAAARLLQERLGYGEIVVVPNGVDVQPVARGSLVGTLSAHEPVKGLDVFLDAVPLVLAQRPATRFIVFGTGSLEADLRARARGMPVEFPGHVPSSDALAQLAVLALPSHMETSGLALLEAMAAGIPAVATRVGGIAETAPPGAATLVEPGDPAALADAIVTLLDDPADQIAAGRAAAAERTSARTAERMLALYEAALSARPAARRPRTGRRRRPAP